MHTVAHGEFDNFIQQHFGCAYQSAEINEWPAGTEYSFLADPSRLSEFDREQVVRFQESGFSFPMPSPDALLSILAEQGVLPEGHYLIRVS